MYQIIFAGYGDALNSGATEYNSIMGGLTWHATENIREQVIASEGDIDRLFVELDAAPGAGAGDAYTFTLSVNGAPAALTCTIVQPDTSGSDTSNSVAVSPGDLVTISCAPVSTPSATPKAQWTMRYKGDTSNASLFLGCSAVAAGTTSYAEASGGVGPQGTLVENEVRRVIPTNGTLGKLYVKLNTAPGAGKTFSVTLRKGGASQTLTVPIVDANTTGNDTAHTVSVSAGDIVTMMAVSDSVSTIAYSFGMEFIADIDGESVILGGYSDSLSNSATEYNCLNSRYDRAWTATETDRQQLGLDCLLRKLYILLSGSPGAGNKYTFKVRQNAADSGLEVEVADAATTGNETAYFITANDGDSFAMASVPDSTPTILDAYWGLVCYKPTAYSSPACFDMAVI